LAGSQAKEAFDPNRLSRENSIAAARSNRLIRRRPAGMIRPILRRGIGYQTMRRPVVGVIGNAYRIENRFATQMVGERNLRAVADVAGALPLMFAGTPDITDIGALLDAVDGIVLTGARANVHPTRFRTEPDPRHEPYDLHRDDLALALSEVCVARGIPLFGICRGLQEMNVAFGGSLHPEIRDLPGRMNHRMPRLENGEIHPDPKVIFADRHEVSLVPDGAFARILGCDTIRVNSLHGQGILEPGERVVVEGTAEDGTIEAIRIADAPGFALGVQWHAEYDPQRNPINRALFQAFGEALMARKR
jgi:putative glutamine amidotransferase